MKIGIAILPIFLSAALHAGVWTGIDVLQKDEFAALKGNRVGLITNQTGVNRKGVRTIDLLYRAETVRLVRIFSPEHGLTGRIAAGKAVSDSVDPRTGVPVVSLYGMVSSPTDAMFDGIDTIVYDLQDVGTRFYTYITTMGMALKKAAGRKVRFVVLDRPNPLRGDILEGDVLSPDVKRLTGYYPIPTRYGLTIGELASWWNAASALKADLTIIKMRNWKRSQWYDQTRLMFIPPSPNITSLNEALLYSGIGSLEATNVSVGRGTDSPFELIGAPWISGKELCAYIREKNFPGLLVESASFVPRSDLYKGNRCGGVRFLITDRNAVRPFHVFLSIFYFLHQRYPNRFQPDWPEIEIVTGSRRLEKAVLNGTSLDALLDQYAEDRNQFLKKVAPFYLYPADSADERRGFVQ